MRAQDFKKHEVHDTIRTARSELSSFLSAAKSGLIDLDQQSSQIDYIEWCLEKSDTALLDPAMLDSITFSILSFVDFLQNNGMRTRENPEEAELASFQLEASKHLLQAIDLVRYPRIKQIFGNEAHAQIEGVRKRAQSAISLVSQVAAAAQEKLKADMATLSASQSKEADRLKQQEQLLSDLQQAIADQKATVATDASAKAAVFDQLISDRKSILDAWASSIETQGQDFLSKIEDYYKLTANTTLAGRFEHAATEERNAYRTNLRLSIIFFVAAIIFVLIDILKMPLLSVFGLSIGSPQGTIDPLFAWLGRVSMIAVCLIPASIFAAQASKHRRAATWYRTLGVRIATLKPYLSEFTGDYSDELKEIIKSFFVSELQLDARQRNRLVPDSRDLERVTQFIDSIKGLRS